MPGPGPDASRHGVCTHFTRVKPACFVLLVAALGCGSSPGVTVGGNDAADTSTGTPDGGGEGSAVLGGFLVELKAGVPATATDPAVPAFTSIIGKVNDGPIPPTIIWQDKQSASGCTMMEVHVPFCNPGCGSSAACVADGQCVSYPTGQDVGTVTVKGVGLADVTLVAASNTYQAPITVTLPYPPAAEGAAIDLQATGGKLGAFAVHAVGVTPLEFAGPVPLETGKPVNLTWKAPSNLALTQIEIHLDISHHGGTKAKIECLVRDTGTLSIPEPLITRLAAVGIAGFPSIVMTRVSEGWTSVAAGKISLRVASSVEREIQIPGLVSCTEDKDCPTGKTCQQDLKCQ
jgi:hypothetical protein